MYNSSQSLIMFEIEKKFSFEAGHRLTHHDGLCQGMHGHSYSVTVVVRKQSLHTTGPKKAMTIDFGDVKTVVQPMIEKYFDHKWLNDTLATDSPTAEYIALWIFQYLEPHLEGLFRVDVQETASGKASYIRDNL